MIICTEPQGTPGWHADRAGAITASMFRIARSKTGGLTEQQGIYVKAILTGKSKDEAKEIAGYKAIPKAEAVEQAIAGLKVGDFSDAAKNYAFGLAAERIAGKPLGDKFETWQMKRGHDLEPLAREAIENRLGVVIESCSLVKTDDHKFGASADGFIGKKSGVEIKCLIGAEPLRTVIIDNDIAFYKDQIQGGMWITGRTHWIYAMFCPDLAPANADLYWRVIKRDDDYINALEADLIEFDGLVESYRAAILAAQVNDPNESFLDEIFAG